MTMTKTTLWGCCALVWVGSVGAFAPVQLIPASSQLQQQQQPALFGVLQQQQQQQKHGLTSYQAFSKSSSSTRLYMGWGPDPIWTEAPITSTKSACKSGICVTVTIQVSSETAAAYTTPGQYVQVKLAGDADAKPLFLAMSSAPPSSSSNDENDDPASTATDTVEFEFLIKKTDGNVWLTDGTATLADVSQVLGGGFPIEENLNSIVKYDFPTQNVILLGVGSGIAPLKAAIESNQLLLSDSVSGKPGRTARLYYGVRTPDDLCFVDRFDEWERMGYQVVPVMSGGDDDASASAWQGRTGYVQNALEEDGVPIPRNSGALLCGMKGMAEAVKDILLKAGVFEGRVLTNF
mmetsp:Transcript_28883/g.52862  ORF Transcript_28883/g.52862 Transcript_28883/m.52862 type:complete len:349 (-) Transcript_28883:149-1195(-)